MIFKSTSALKTKKIARAIIDTATENHRHDKNNALVIGLIGELGSGKTTFVKGIAEELGIASPITSPTFLLIRRYRIKKKKSYSNLFHIDAYRTNKISEFRKLGIKHILSSPISIVLIEWADKIKKLLPRETVWITFSHGKKKNERIIKLHGQAYGLLMRG